MYSRVRSQRLVEPHAVPALGDLRAGDAEAQPEPAPVNTSRLAAVIAVIAGFAAGICITAEPTSICEVWAASQARTVGTVRAVRLGRPDHREAEGLGVLSQPQLPTRIVGSDQITEVQPRRMADTVVPVLSPRTGAPPRLRQPARGASR